MLNWDLQVSTNTPVCVHSLLVVLLLLQHNVSVVSSSYNTLICLNTGKPKGNMTLSTSWFIADCNESNSWVWEGLCGCCSAGISSVEGVRGG